MNSRVLVYIFSALFIVGCLSCTQALQGIQAEDHYQHGIMHLFRGDGDAAAEEFENALEKRPEYIPYQLNKARALLMAGKLSEALSEVEKVIDRDRENAEAYVVRAAIWRKDDNREWGIADMSAAIALEPQNFYFYLNRAQLYAEEDDYDKALEDLDRASEWGPRQPAVYIYRGYIKGKHEEYEQAAEEFRRALKYDPRNVFALFNLGLALLKSEEYEAADDALSDCIDISENFASAYYYRGKVRIGLNQAEMGFYDIRESVRLDKEQQRPKKAEEREQELEKLVKEYEQEFESVTDAPD